MKPDYTRLYKALAYQFNQADYLTTALTHRSAGSPNNERLEFLGDALLNCIMAKTLFDRFPVAREGELTRLRATLVKRETLVKVAVFLELGKYLLLGEGELKTGGGRRPSILADAMEATIGAIYLDGGFSNCQQVILQLWHQYIENLSPKKICKDPKTRLQEYLQGQQAELPIYNVLEVVGDSHDQCFKVECIVPGLSKPTYGNGETRRYAEQNAAALALRYLNVE